MNYFLCTLLLVLWVCQVQAQAPSARTAPKIGVISGTVLDSATTKPLEFATVSVYRLRDSALVGGIITNAKGQFKIEQLPIGKHRVTVSFMGYRTYTIPEVALSFQAQEANLGAIIIAPNAALLDGIEVTAEQSAFQLGLDKRVFNVDKTNLGDSENATEVLRNTPTVEVDFDGAVKVRGSSVQVYINGKPTGLTGDSQAEILDQLPANSIKKVELITSPSAKYDPEGGGGIINIVLKKNVLEGFTGTVNASVGTSTWAPFQRYRGGLSLNFRNDKINFFSNFSYNNNRNFSRSYNYRVEDRLNSTSILEQYSNNQRWHTGGMARVGFDYYFNPNNTLTIAARIRPSQGNGEGSIQYDFFDEDFNKTGITERLNKSNQTRFNQTYNVIYSLVFPKKGDKEGSGVRRDNSSDGGGGRRRWRGGSNGRASGGRGTMGDKQELVIDLQYANNGREEFEYFDQQGYNPAWVALNDAQQLQNTTRYRGMHQGTAMIDYTHPLPKDMKVEAGYKGNIRWMRNDFRSESFDFNQQEFVNDAGLTNAFEFTEHVHAGYVTFAQKIKKFQYKLGFRAEYTSAESRLVDPANNIFINNYPSFFPTVNLSYELKNSQQLQLSFSRRIERPSTWALNPFPSFSDPLNLRFGNPFLLPQLSNTVELSYAKYWKKGHTLMLTGFYRYDTDLINRLRTVNDEGVVSATYYNFNTSQQWGLEAVTRFVPAKWFNFGITGSVYQNIQDGSNIDDNFSVNAIAGNANVYANFTFKFGMRISAYAWISMPQYVPQGWTAAYTWNSVSVSQKVLKDKGRVTLSIQNPILGGRWQYQTEANGFNQSGLHQWENPVFEARFSYRFGKINVRDGRSKNASRLNKSSGGDGGESNGPM